MAFNTIGVLWSFTLFLLLPNSVSGMMASPHAFTVDNANFTIALKISGDEQSHWLTDMDGKAEAYVIVMFRNVIIGISYGRPFSY